MKYAVFYTSMLIFIAISCHEEPILNFGFDTEFSNRSNGSTSIDVSNAQKSIVLNGEVILTEGEIEIELVNPLEQTVYACQLVSPVRCVVNESFAPVPGTWILKYHCSEGSGKIKLHLNVFD